MRFGCDILFSNYIMGVGDPLGCVIRPAVDYVSTYFLTITIISPQRSEKKEKKLI